MKKELKKKPIKFTRPTVAIKHKKVFDKMVENGGNLSKAIRDSGLYSHNQSLHPEKITNSKTWAEIVENELPDNVLTKNHKELLEQVRVDYFVFAKSMSDEEIKEHVASAGLTVITVRESDKGKMAFYSVPDAQAKKGALEMAYKLKGRFGDDMSPKLPAGNTYNFIFSGPVREKVNIIEAEIKDLLIKKPDVKKD